MTWRSQAGGVGERAHTAAVSCRRMNSATPRSGLRSLKPAKKTPNSQPPTRARGAISPGARITRRVEWSQSSLYDPTSDGAAVRARSVVPGSRRASPRVHDTRPGRAQTPRLGVTFDPRAFAGFGALNFAAPLRCRIAGFSLLTTWPLGSTLSRHAPAHFKQRVRTSPPSMVSNMIPRAA
jgi:hypothetical protein